MKIGFQIEACLCITEFFHKRLVEGVVLRRYDGSGAGCRTAADGICFAENIIDACLL